MRTSLESHAVENCVLAHLRRLRFPATSGGVVVVTQAIELRTSGAPDAQRSGSRDAI